MIETATIIEITAVVLNVAYVILAARKQKICWLFGGMASLLSVYLFYTSKLYSESGLYFFYAIMAIVGYRSWQRASGDDEGLAIHSWRLAKHVPVVLLGAMASALLAYLMATYTDASYPTVDAFTTVFSIIATVMTIQRVISNWIYWIIINAVSAVLYHLKGLDIYALLMLAFTILAYMGYRSWHKESHLSA